MLDYNRRNMINLFFENDKSKQPTTINDLQTQQTWTVFTEYQPNEIIQKYHEVTKNLQNNRFSTEKD